MAMLYIKQLIQFLKVNKTYRINFSHGANIIGTTKTLITTIIKILLLASNHKNKRQSTLKIIKGLTGIFRLYPHNSLK